MPSAWVLISSNKGTRVPWRSRDSWDEARNEQLVLESAQKIKERSVPKRQMSQHWESTQMPKLEQSEQQCKQHSNRL